MAIVHINVPNGSQLSLLKTEDYTSYSSKVSAGSGYSTFESWFLDKNTNFWTYSDNSFDFGLFTLNWKHTGGDSNRQLIWSVVRNSDSQSLISATWNLGGIRPTIEFYVDFAIDRENQKGYIVIIGFQYLQFESKDQITRDLGDGGQDFYNLLVPPTGGGAGSGYIGNSLLSNKKMVGYNVPTSSAEGTKTESVNDVSASAVSGKPKSGNGFARIKFLRNNDWRCLESIEVDGVDCPLLQINDFSIIPNTYGGTETLIRRQSGIYTPSGVSDLGSEFAQPTISSGTVEKSTNYNNVIFRTTFGYNAQAYSNFNQNEIIYNTNTVLMTHGFLLATEANTRLYIGIALNDVERYGCCYFVAQYPDRNWTTENYSGGDGEIGYLIYSIFSNS